MAVKEFANTIMSVFENRIKKCQIIVVNDGSTDNTLELLKNKFELYQIRPVVNQSMNVHGSIIPISI